MRVTKLYSELREDGLIIPLFLATAIAVLTIVAAVVVVERDSDLWLNLTAEFVGIVLGGIVVAVVFEHLLERRQLRQSEQIQKILEDRQQAQSKKAREEILKQLNKQVAEVAYVARTRWRRGLRLEPIDDDLKASTALARFREQLAVAKFEKYEWLFDLDREDLPTGPEDAQREYVEGAEEIAFTVKHVVPPMKAYVPVAAATGQYNLLGMLLAFLETDTLLRYSEARYADGASKLRFASSVQGQILPFLSTASEFFALVEKDLGPKKSPFEEKFYREQREQWAEDGF